MLSRILQTKFKYLFSKSYVRILPDATFNIGKHVDISDSHIVVCSGGKLEIGDNVKIKKALIFINNGCVKIEDNVQIGGGISKTSIYLQNGDCEISSHAIIGDTRKESEIRIDKGIFRLGAFSKFAGSLIWIRFGGILKIGEYTNINHGTELRCDERICIGNYCQISYNIRIWDTNTHEILAKESRRDRTREFFPIFGMELDKPKTKPITVGDDCWIGEYCSILKGCKIGNECILGFHTLLSDKQIPSGRTVINITDTKII